MRIFSDFSLRHIFESENFRFPFSTKQKKPNMGMKCEKFNLKSYVICKKSFGKLYMNGTVKEF